MGLFQPAAQLVEQYKLSLKVTEIEEAFDLLIYRPVAFLFVKLVYPTNLTPNQVSAIAMVVGAAGGVLFGFGYYNYLLLGSCLYFVCNVLDCADGQIARLKKTGTKIGRIVDGFIDYVVSSVVYAGIACGLTRLQLNSDLILSGNIFNLNPYVYIWMLSLLAGLSSAFQAVMLDFYRNKYLEYAYGKFNSLEEEIKEFEEEKIRINQPGAERGFLDNLLITVYLKYTRLQLEIQKKRKKLLPGQIPDPGIYYSKNKVLIHFWSYIGSTTHLTICLICASANKIEFFLLICILPLNLVMLVLYLIQNRVNKNLT
jgi:phosphatidylglycerophosphate synthase